MLENFNKKYLILLAIGTLIIIVLVVFLVRAKTPTQTVDNVFDNNFKPDVSTIALDTEKGPININNVFKGAKKYSDGIQSSYVIAEGIEYDAGGGVNAFLLTASNDTGDILQKENLLLSMLGVSKDNACVVPVIEYVTNKNKEEIYYRDKFTFCNQ